ncbi:MAG: hypothetical protein EHM17_07525 [Verrucomicrobiaceae bacterium]|nr:MAG: hypothetical protein EHM17_14315 [Verrucomicrobiaceae bacterium]RPJ34185.1 MAG: hypothetical protein EHM17_07525 [Verrucomicrobiaceae bacterium]
MQAIQTKYFGPTNTKGSRIKATCAAGSLTIDYPHELSGQACHRKAAEALAAKLGWSDHDALLGGQLPDHSYVFVFDNALSRG